MKNKKSITILINIFIFLAGSSLGFLLGTKIYNDAANSRAAEMILNDEIPNYYLEVETVDYLINNNSGKLEELVKPKRDFLRKK
ncbi:hypothetical protein SD427_18720 (plasmid) [Chryseobacterium sp. JJR-5R]|uniref:hypothetical protein n=1 Tax=Chryseobacterium sp. JJR-5R TaxID=3093923 RepID=UPI002A74AD2C|nr:hypothetical protein [Chryseobacterium sp. JJR-5R]WPO84633.1 hypothetical protein SD427_18720 [Chryseobacterium sp. JJR-5R]